MIIFAYKTFDCTKRKHEVSLELDICALGSNRNTYYYFQGFSLILDLFHFFFSSGFYVNLDLNWTTIATYGSYLDIILLLAND